MCGSPGGFRPGSRDFPKETLAFIRETQPEEWTKLERLHGDRTGEEILGYLCKWMDQHGSLATVRHGFECYGRTLRVAWFKPAHKLSPELEARYAANGRWRDRVETIAGICPSGHLTVDYNRPRGTMRASSMMESPTDVLRSIAEVNCLTSVNRCCGRYAR